MPTNAVVDDERMRALDAVTRDVAAPFAVVDLDAFDANADDLARRASGVPIRLATKSVRVRELVSRALLHPGFHGVLAYSLAEAMWLAAELPAGHDVVVAYPTVDRGALAAYAADPGLRERIALVVDDVVHLRLLRAALESAGPQARARVWLDVDCSLKLGRAHLGARRSPLHSVEEVVAAVRQVLAEPSLHLVGLMFYDAQIAGVADSAPHVRLMQIRSEAELGRRRRRVVEAVDRLVPVGAVNAGGTGSLHVMSAAPEVTELAAGSGLLGPHLFDSYRSFRPRPAAFFATEVVRRPGGRYVTTFGGGYAASGVAGASRNPLPWWPAGLSYSATEGAGEVQTPLRAGRGAALPEIGDRVWFRHAKAGEVFERFERVVLVRGERVVGTAPTYRGEGRCFG